MTPIIYTDYYKTEHFRMYPEGTTYINSNLTPRKSRLPGVNSIVFFGLQHFIIKYLLQKFTNNFFNVPWEQVEDEYKYAINTDTKHIKALHDLGYMPLIIRAVPEGARVPIRVPCMTIENTKPEFYWLVNYLETLISCQLWQPITSATIAAEYNKILTKYALETTGSDSFVQWQGHDFSMRGMSSLESAILSGMGHLTSFTGTDTIPAIYALKNSYGSNNLIGASVPATEHSVMCMGEKRSEQETFERLLDLYPTGILSVVSDTWDLWKVITEFLPALKEKILARDGKLVIRPDSGDPVDIICGRNVPVFQTFQEVETAFHHNLVGTIKFQVGDKTYKIISHSGTDFKYEEVTKTVEEKGVIELLWDIFGGKINEYGYKELDVHIGAIYGDSITLDRAKQICDRLKAKGFASTNIVFGVGSFTYQFNTRDTFGFAVKATFGRVLTTELVAHGPGVSEWDTYESPRAIFKDPVTDDGTKKSARGLVTVLLDEKGEYYLKDMCSPDEVEAETNQLKPVFKDGKLLIRWTLDDIRERIKKG